MRHEALCNTCSTQTTELRQSTHTSSPLPSVTSNASSHWVCGFETLVCTSAARTCLLTRLVVLSHHRCDLLQCWQDVVCRALKGIFTNKVCCIFMFVPWLSDARGAERKSTVSWQHWQDECSLLVVGRTATSEQRLSNQWIHCRCIKRFSRGRLHLSWVILFDVSVAVHLCLRHLLSLVFSAKLFSRCHSRICNTG